MICNEQKHNVGCPLFYSRESGEQVLVNYRGGRPRSLGSRNSSVMDDCRVPRLQEENHAQQSSVRGISSAVLIDYTSRKGQ
jgi:hypothetical protein